jgi:glucose/arabinose dehydrogenase
MSPRGGLKGKSMAQLRYRQLFLLAGLICSGLLAGCYSTAISNGGGQIATAPARTPNPADIWVPPGYKVELVTQGLNFPTGVTFDEKGRVYVTESGYSYGEVFRKPRLLRVVSDGVMLVVAKGNNGPWNGVTYYNGDFYVAEGGELQGGRILKVSSDGAAKALVDDLPSLGDHHTNGPVIGADGYLYFGQGTATNSGVVGKDNYANGWLKRHPDFHDIPGQDIVLTGQNFETTNPFHPAKINHWYQELFPTIFVHPKFVQTGAYSAFGKPTRPGQVIKGQLPCTGAVMRVPVQGGPLELVAWGLRNPFGLAFSPDGKLFVTENQTDVRGSRPIFGTGDLLWEIKPGQWYGWPDYFAGEPVNNANRFAAPNHPAPTRLLAKMPGVAPKPVAKFGVHASADGFDFCRDDSFGPVGDAFVAEFGDLAPVTGKVEAPVGFRVCRVETEGGIIHPFVVNKGPYDAPASKLGTGGLERPIAARFDPTGKALYVVDFGIMMAGPKGVEPVEGTGVLWKITRQ